MIIALLYLFFRAVAIIIDFALHLFMMLVLNIIEFFKAFILELIRVKRETKETQKESDEESIDKEKGNYVIVKLTEKGWTPIQYFETYEEGYQALKCFRSQPNAPFMMLQKIK